MEFMIMQYPKLWKTIKILKILKKSREKKHFCQFCLLPLVYPTKCLTEFNSVIWEGQRNWILIHSIQSCTLWAACFGLLSWYTRSLLQGPNDVLSEKMFHYPMWFIFDCGKAWLHTPLAPLIPMNYTIFYSVLKILHINCTFLFPHHLTSMSFPKYAKISVVRV